MYYSCIIIVLELCTLHNYFYIYCTIMQLQYIVASFSINTDIIMLFIPVNLVWGDTTT